MKLTRRQRWWLCGLVVALIAMAMDRLLLPRPAAATARPAPSPTSRPSAATPNIAALDAAIAELGRVLSADPTRVEPSPPDVFARTRAAAAVLADAPPPQPAPTRADEFAARYRLAATITGAAPAAVIGRRVIRIGETIETFTLRAVGDGWAEFVSDDGSVRLEVPRRTSQN
ncbi:MAG: hypothetical protein CHACPFDD_00018 [Phycisphaerae bacterium]|nr:hypothetical protein [Phycisphaerae bacterium]